MARWFGSILRGDLAVSDCGRCDEPPCLAPWLECDAISQSKSKATPCGYLNAGSYYAVRSTTWTYTVDSGGCFFGGGDPDYRTERYSSTRTSTKSIVSGNCVEFHSWAGTASVEVACDDYFYGCYATQAADGSWTGGESSGISLCCFGNCPPSGSSVVTTYSSLVSSESTADLITRTIAALPDYPGTYSGACSSYRNLSPDESSYSIRRTKWRVVHEPTGLCYLRVWLQKRFTPEGGGADVITPLTPYEWTGTGTPCFTEPMLPPNAEENIVRSSPTEEIEPSTDGTTVIEILKWSCVPGYTPPDDGSANGYPVPA